MITLKEKLAFAKEMDPYKHDGSYKLVQEIVKALKNSKILDVKDLDMLYFATIGTWESSFEDKKEKISNSNLNDSDKVYLIKLLENLKKNARNYFYENSRYNGTIGMFATGFFTFENKIKAQDANEFLKFCIDIFEIKDQMKILENSQEFLNKDLKGIGVASTSQILHCIYPNIFPIINSKVKEGIKLYKEMDVEISKIYDLKNYIIHTKNMIKFRDENFSFKNFRIIDLALNQITKEESTREKEVFRYGEDMDYIKEFDYIKEEFLKEVFLEKNLVKDLLWELKEEKNIILQGPSGVGKTFIASKLAKLDIDSVDENIKTIQFHQSYSYEDFIMGFRPSKLGGFELKEGVFYTFCKRASINPKQNFYFVIDEINRGNLSKIFGETLMLMEKDKRGIKNKITLSYENEIFYIPSNVYIIATMNPNDRSIVDFDFAMRRRFSFFDIEPAFESEKFKNYLLSKGLSKKIIRFISFNMNNLNKKIIDESFGLGKSFCIGHSYFCNPDLSKQSEEVWYKKIIDYKIAPLIRTYWFEDLEFANKEIERLNI